MEYYEEEPYDDFDDMDDFDFDFDDEFDEFYEITDFDNHSVELHKYVKLPDLKYPFQQTEFLDDFDICLN